MPRRFTPLVTDQIYHVFNRGIDGRPTFTDRKEYKRAVLTLRCYRYRDFPQKLSQFLLQAKDARDDTFSDLLKKGVQRISMLAYCLMPNHFHFLLRQEEDHGISRFMSDVQNSYTRYFNTKHKRQGALFLNQFKAVHIGTDEGLMHVGRYIHLNPYSGFVVKDLRRLAQYPWSSFPTHLGKTDDRLSETTTMLSSFENRNAYRRFHFDRADYQRTLEHVKHLLLEES